MVDEGIVNYVKDSLRRGMNVEDVKAALREKQWPEEEINQAILMGGSSQLPVAQPRNVPPQQAQPAKEKKSGGVSKKLIIALFVFVLLFIALIYVSVNIVDTFYTMFPESSGALGINLPFSG
ncbi:MAG: hypothetical protein JW789_02025 [Candidatus Aenigmarchaeota archaeon]|nr:hypothetical protein [Candidatus Aenigmarchaeota archaeon]